MWEAWRPPDLLALTARRPLDPSLVWAMVGLGVVLLFGAALIVWVGRWQQQQREQSADSAAVDFQALFEQGLLSQEELERIRRRQAQGGVCGPSPAAGPSQVPPPANASRAPRSPPEAPSAGNHPPGQPDWP